MGHIEVLSTIILSFCLSPFLQIIFKAGNQRITPSRDRILNSSQIVVDQSSVRFHPYASFFLFNKEGQQLLFADASHLQLKSPRSLQSLAATRVTASKVS